MVDQRRLTISVFWGTMALIVAIPTGILISTSLPAAETANPTDIRLLAILNKAQVSPRWADDPIDVSAEVCPLLDPARRQMISATSDHAWSLATNSGWRSCFFQERLLIVEVSPQSAECRAVAMVPPPSCAL